MDPSPSGETTGGMSCPASPISEVWSTCIEARRSFVVSYHGISRARAGLPNGHCSGQTFWLRHLSRCGSQQLVSHGDNGLAAASAQAKPPIGNDCDPGRRSSSLVRSNVFLDRGLRDQPASRQTVRFSNPRGLRTSSGSLNRLPCWRAAWRTNCRQRLGSSIGTAPVPPRRPSGPARSIQREPSGLIGSAVACPSNAAPPNPRDLRAATERSHRVHRVHRQRSDVIHGITTDGWWRTRRIQVVGPACPSGHNGSMPGSGWSSPGSGLARSCEHGDPGQRVHLVSQPGNECPSGRNGSRSAHLCGCNGLSSSRVHRGPRRPSRAACRTPRPWMQRVRSGPDEPRSQTPFAVPGSTDDKRASGGPSPNGGGLSGFDPDRLFGPSLPQWENLRATSFPEKSSQRLER